MGAVLKAVVEGRVLAFASLPNGKILRHAPDLAVGVDLKQI